MNQVKLILDLAGIGVEIYLAMLFYGMFWDSKVLKKRVYVAGFAGFAMLNVGFIQFFQNSVWLPIACLLTIFMLSFYFQGRLVSRIFLAIIFTALMVGAEAAVGTAMTSVFEIPADYFQKDWVTYAIGVFVSKTLALILVSLIRFFYPPANPDFGHHRFSLVLILLPFQSIVLCLVVQELLLKANSGRVQALAIFVLATSLLLIFVTAFILNYQLKSMAYAQKYEFTRYALQAQIKQYNELCAAQDEIRTIRHDLKNELVAIAGSLLSHGSKDAAERIEKMQEHIRATEDVTSTGFPAVDAILGAKLRQAQKENIKIHDEVLIDHELIIDPFDIAIVLANALDNALEAIARNPSSNRDIRMMISSKVCYLSILVENYTDENIGRDLRSSKKDKSRHGFGIPQMKMIVAKYDGHLQIDCDPKTGRFSLKILLKNQSA
jgi:sensor histidine kinase YesM